MADEKTSWFRSPVFNNLVGLLALVTAIVGLVVSLTDKSPELTVSTLRNTEAPRPSEKGLQVSYAFNGQQIAAAWLFTIRVQNTGRSTVIGRGDKSTLISKVIPLKFQGIDRVLTASAQDGEALGLKVEVREQKFLDISFDQLKPGESFVVDAILDKGSDGASVKIAAQERSLINGDIRFDTVTNALESKSERPAWVPLSLWKPMALMSAFVSAVLSAAFLFMLGFGLVERIRYTAWRQSNLAHALKAAEALHADESAQGPATFDLPSLQRALSETPWLLDDEYWEKLESRGAKRATVRSLPLFESSREAWGMGFGLLFIGAVLAISGGVLATLK